MKTLPLSFYRREDTVTVARELLGKILISREGKVITSGRIVETEAYSSRNDRACHAHAGKKTARNEVMFEAGGLAYVYLCYGIHHLFNIVTNKRERADAVLVRAIEPVGGIKHMLRRRGLERLEPRVSNGPGSLTRALGITGADNRRPLTGGRLRIADDGRRLASQEIIASPRVGIDYAGGDAQLPWRFRLRNSPWIGK